MKVTVFKRKGTKETVVREDMNTIVDAISGGKYVNEVHRLRQYWLSSKSLLNSISILRAYCIEYAEKTRPFRPL